MSHAHDIAYRDNKIRYNSELNQYEIHPDGMKDSFVWAFADTVEDALSMIDEVEDELTSKVA